MIDIIIKLFLKPMKRSIILTCLSLLIYSNAFSQSNVWTLEKCFSYAKENNIQLKQTQINTELSELDLEQSKSNRLPFVSGVFNQRLNFGRSIDPTTNQFRSQTLPTTFIGLNTGVDVFRGFNLKNSIKRSELSLKDAKFQENIQENNLGLSIVSAYLEILRSKDQLNVLNEQLSITQQQKSRIEKLINAGVLPKGDILNIESQIANEQLGIVNAENALSFAKLNLMQILEYYEEEIDVAIPEIEVPSPEELANYDVEKIYTLSLKNLPEIKSAELQKDIAETDVELAKGQQYPTVTLAGGASSNYAGIKLPTEYEEVNLPIGVAVNGEQQFPVFPIVPFNVPVEGGKTKAIPFGTQINENFSYNIGVNVSVPIFNRNQIKNGIKRSEIAMKNAELTQKIAQNTLYQTIQQAYQVARAASKAYETNKKNIISLEQSLANIEKRYDLGLSTALEYATARNNLAVAKLNLNSAKYEYMFRLKILDFYAGKSLNLK